MNTAAITKTIERWAAAEQTGDTSALDELIADDFLGIGPMGFVLDKHQWLGRYDGDHLHYRRFEITVEQERTYGDVTLIVGLQDQEGDHEGRPVDGRFRLTLVLVTSDGAGPRIAGLQLSLTQPPDRPRP